MMYCSDFWSHWLAGVSRLVVMALAWLGLSGAVEAQSNLTSSAKPLSAQEALKDIQPMGQSCRRDDLLSPSNKSIAQTPKEISPDMTCAITATELNLWLLAKDIVAIDTRSASEYSQYRIDGAVNLPSQDIRYKPQFNSKSIALIGTGKQERELFALCATLKANGYRSVRVLQGGMLAWHTANLPILGRTPPIDSMRILGASQLLAETYFNANFIIASASRSEMASHIKHTVTATSDDVETIITQLDLQQKKKPSVAINSVVWLAPVNTKLESIAQLQTKLLALPKPLPLLVYADSTGNFQKFMAQQQAMLAAQARGPKQPACGV